MKIGITDSEKKLLFIVLALAILVCTYFFVFTKLNDQAAIIEASNAQDEGTVATLQGMVDRQAETQKQTEEYKQTIKDIVAKYPVGILQEKSIYLIQTMQDEIGVAIPSISFSMDNLVMNFSGENAPSGRSVILGISYTTTYDRYKQLLKYVSELDDRTVIPSISASFDQSTGYISGSLTYKMYFLTNTGKEYVDFPPTGIESGVPSLFYTEDLEWEGLDDFYFSDFANENNGEE